MPKNTTQSKIIIQPKLVEDKNNTVKKPSVENILKTFKSNLLNVDFFFNRFGGLAEDEDEEVRTNVANYLTNAFQNAGIDVEIKKKEDVDSKIKDQQTLQLNNSQFKEFLKIIKKTPKTSNQNFAILSSSSFLMLNNYFEYLIADLLTYYYNKFKDTLNSKEFKVSLKEIAEYESIEDLEKFLILKEVETMLIEQSFEGLLVHFEKVFKLNLNNEIIDWSKINECRERRHLIVHNASIVNKKYIARTNNPENKKIGDKIDITRDYFQSIYNEIKLAGFLLTYECWGSWDKDNATSAINDMLTESFEYLLQKNVVDCERITTYLDKIQARNEEEENMLIKAKFNKCISLKKLNKKAELNKILSNIKVGTSTPLFKLAHAILSDKNDTIIFDLVQKAHKLSEVNYELYNEWPLFETIRTKKILNTKITQELKN